MRRISSKTSFAPRERKKELTEVAMGGGGGEVIIIQLLQVFQFLRNEEEELQKYRYKLPPLSKSTTN